MTLKFLIPKYGVADGSVCILPSHPNFLLLRFLDETQANAIELYLKERGFILRKVGSYGLPNSLRLSVGKSEICENLYLTLTEYFNNNDRI